MKKKEVVQKNEEVVVVVAEGSKGKGKGKGAYTWYSASS